VLTVTLEPLPTEQPTQEPEVQAEPSVEPTPAPTPATPVDGIADAMLQAYLYSDEFKSTRGDLNSGDSGDAVMRLQNRLKNRWKPE
jgi:hypothetical protein